MAVNFDTITSKPKKTPNRFSSSDVDIAKAYMSKANNAVGRGIPFTLSFVGFKSLCKAKKCYFTGLPLTPETFSIDRVDSFKGYETGNVVACHTSFNALKGIVENKDNPLGLELATKGLIKCYKRILKGEDK